MNFRSTEIQENQRNVIHIALTIATSIIEVILNDRDDLTTTSIRSGAIYYRETLDNPNVHNFVTSLGCF